MRRCAEVFIYIIFMTSFNQIAFSGIFHQFDPDSLQNQILLIQKQIENDPENDRLYCRLGYMYLEIKEWKEAESTFEKSIILNDTSFNACNGLGLAHHHQGKSFLKPLEAIKKILKIDNFSKAEKYFLKALELNPDLLKSRYNLSVNYLSQPGKKNYIKAVENLKMILEKDLFFQDADFMLGVAFQLLEEYENAELIFKGIISANPANGKTMLRLSEICMEQGKYTEGTHYYYDGLLNLKDSDILNDLYSEIQILLSSEDQKKYENLPVTEKGLFIKKYWKSKDPTPTTELNERYTEHFQRVKYASHNFSTIVPPYYDDRGKIYVKYGPPDAKHVAQDYQDGAKPNESWSYEQSVCKGLTFDFVKKGPVYYQVHDLSEASPTGMIGQGREEWLARLYEVRAGFTDSYNRFLNRYGSDLQKEISDFSHERMIAESKAPPEIYYHMSMEKELPFVYNFSQFKGSNGKSLLEIYSGVAYKNLQFSESNDHIYSSLVFTVAAMDFNFNDVYKNSRNVTVLANSIDETTGKLFIDLDSITLPPGNYYLALAMSNTYGNRKGEYRNPLTIRNFNQTNLMLSDIQFSSFIEPVNEEGLFTKNQLKVIPYPYAVIKRQQPVYIYYEIYNLKINSSGQTDYIIDQSITMISQKRSLLDKTFGSLGRLFSKKKKSEISTQYHQTGNQPTSIEYLSIDMEKMPLGKAQLSLTVTDNTSGEIFIQNREFELID